MIFENVYFLLAIETILAIYLIDTYYKIKNDVPGNIYIKWNDKYNAHGEKSFFDFSRYTDNVFKKHVKVENTDKGIKDDFINFIDELNFYFTAFCLIFAIIIAIYFLLRLLSNFLLKLFHPKQNYHILSPGKYNDNCNAHDWLDNFELFLEEGKITTHAERCGAFLSRLDGQTKQTLCNYDRHVKTNYNTLKDAFIKIFAKKKKTAQEYHADFLSCCQGDMNLYHYHAELCRLVKRAFPTLSERQRDEMIYERFTSGINNDIIRGQLLASYKITNLFGRVFRGKTLLDRAVELEEIYGKGQVNINLVRTDKSNVVCYRCQEKGHYANDCKTQQKTNQDNSNTSNNNYNNKKLQNNRYQKPQQNGSQQNSTSNTNMFHLNKIEYTNAITGSCMLDGQSTHFMMDTGANKTVIDVKLLNDEQRKEIRHVPFTVILADGSRVPAMC